MLKIVDVSVAFGGLRVLDKVNIEAAPGRITGLVGPNGSGKSTLLDVVSGVLVPESGSVVLNGHPVRHFRPDLVAALGVGRTFQIPRLARQLSVFQNMLVGARDNRGENIVDLFLRPDMVRRDERSIEIRAWNFVGRLMLEEKVNEYAGRLSGGQQKLLSMGVLLMADPTVLLLDEPAAGVNPVLIEQQVAFLKELRDEGRTILLVEHNMELISNLCDTVYVLDAGAVIAVGTPNEIRRNETVMRSYLGRPTGAGSRPHP